jgi:hypothetical protein
MAMNRRGILGALAGAATVGNAGIGPVGRDLGISGATQGSQFGMNVAASGQKPPRMDISLARRLVFGDAEALAEIRDELFAEQRNVTMAMIDPDISIMKSWSPMAKLAFQRQRNVERAIDQLRDPPRFGRSLLFLNSLNERLNKLMWE